MRKTVVVILVILAAFVLLVSAEYLHFNKNIGKVVRVKLKDVNLQRVEGGK